MKKLFLILLLVVMSSGFSGCEKFVEVGLPDSRLGALDVFGNDETAMTASNSMYRSLLQGFGLIGGTISNITVMSSLSSDELNDYSGLDEYRQFYVNELSSDNSFIAGTWNAAYNTIYEANAVLEGVTASGKLSAEVKAQLEGEAHFVRALCYFYLVNSFGAVPRVTTTDYRANATLERSASADVYDLIVADLTRATALLTDEYFLGLRARPNRFTATALLARVYLYQGEPALAEGAATTVINNNAYRLVPLSDVFLASSMEAIWQLPQTTPNSFPTADGYLFYIAGDYFPNAISDELFMAFEPDDARRDAWTGTWVNESGTFQFAAKYKEFVAYDNTSFTEYLVPLRLAEQYLIRAEARARQDNLAGAIADLDIIRDRASLSLMTDMNPGIGREDLLAAIAHERRIELFCEMGHRWLDLKRTGKAITEMPAVKPGFTSEDQLYPLPQDEFLRNRSLGTQNPGY